MSMRKSILVLDDSQLALEVMHDALETAGFDVTLANDLRTFERHIATSTPDLILLDVNMPEAFGDDVGAVLRGVRHLTVPIWLFSSMDEARLEARSREAGLSGFISKGAGVDALVKRVRDILGAPETS